MLERVLETAVAQARADSPRVAALLEALNGRRLAIEVSGTPWVGVIESTGMTLKLHRSGSADARLSGAPLSLLALQGADAQAVIRRGDVRIAGDAELAQQFRELLLLLRPDLEALLARLLGRSGAHLLMRAVRGARDWSRAAAWTSVLNASEYLAHETGDLVSRSEAEHVMRGIEQLREQLDRAEAQLQHLERRAQLLGGGAGSA
jgi:ubiquinone biosynthesis protein UbiJ